jgi:hypothetical protein
MMPRAGRWRRSGGGGDHEGVSEAIDHRRLMDEIEAEVRRRRSSGDIPADFERELDLVFARHAPVDALGDDYEKVLERVAHSAAIDVMAPVDSARPGVPLLKKVVRKAVAFEVRHVADQVSGFVHALTRALRLLGERVEALEGAAGGPGTEEARAATPPLDLDHWGPLVAKAVAGAPGRVLHAEAGDGQLVARLAAEGADSYGADLREAMVAAAVDSGLEVRLDEAVDHLRAVPAGALGAVVLSGCVDRLPLDGVLELADLAATRVAMGGTVVVISSHPVAWSLHRSPVEADLAPGRPLSEETWRHLLAARGLEPGETLRGPDADGSLKPVGDPAVDANLERINAVLFPPPTYAVTAVRPS